MISKCFFPKYQYIPICISCVKVDLLKKFDYYLILEFFSLF